MDDIDEEWLYYAFTTILGKSEKEFLESTPKKIYGQLRQHSKFLEERNRGNKNTTKNKNGIRETRGPEIRLKVTD